jgi:hypothetical protein
VTSRDSVGASSRAPRLGTNLRALWADLLVRLADAAARVIQARASDQARSGLEQ